MSADRRINVPSRADFGEVVERLKGQHELDALLAEYVVANLPAEQQSLADIEDIVRRIKQRVDPRLVDALYEPIRAK